MDEQTVKSLERLTKAELISIVVKQADEIEGFQKEKAGRLARVELEHQIAFARSKRGVKE